MKRADIKRRPLADTTLAGLEPESKEYRELDGNGLYFRVKPDGGKSWQLRYKRPAGNWAWMGLGGYPEVSGALARDKAAELRKVVSSGADPLEQKRSAKAAIDAARTRTFRAAAEAWLKAKEEKGLAPSTLNKIRTYLDKDILPALGDKPLDEITRTDCAELQASLEARNAHNVAEKCRTWINQIFGRAIGLGLTENDPGSRLHRRQQLLITALEQELVTIDRHITEAQKECAKIENKAAHLANTVLEEQWNEAAKALLETGGKLWAARRLISRDPVALLKLEIPEQGENFGSWTFRELAERSHQHSLLDLLPA